ncbi:MAG: glycosyl transferase [Candidatus Pelagibacter sp.]|nr:glycosyl transferase [Candidatus Pelagibacter sp.]
MNNFKSISILIPVYNEIHTIEKCIKRVLDSNTLNLDIEIIISDNNSSDGTREILKKINNKKIKCFFKDKNEGKGSNIINALKYANGDLILFQDADLEYHPENYPELIKPFIENDADVVYGSRLTGSKTTKILGWPNLVGNRIFTLFANILFNRIFTDIATGYKIFKKDIIKDINLVSKGFEIEPEITAKISKNKKLSIYEVPITIYSRNYDEGKKVRWWDFFIYIYTLIKWKIIY